MRIKKYLRKHIEIYINCHILQSIRDYPFGNKIKANKDKYLQLHKQAINNEDKKVEEFEENCGFSIDQNWINDLALHTQVVIKKEELNFSWEITLFFTFEIYMIKK